MRKVIPAHLRIKIHEYVIGNRFVSDLPFIADEFLDAGFETPTVIILASYAQKEKIEDHYAKELWPKFLKEINYQWADSEILAAFELLTLTVAQIVTGEIEAVKGMKNAVSLDEQINWPIKEKEYACDNIEFHHLYGLNDTYCELSWAEHQWQEDNTNEELKLEVIEEFKKAGKEFLKKAPDVRKRLALALTKKNDKKDRQRQKHV